MKNNERNKQAQLVNEAKAYFDACGMSESIDAFFTKEPVKALIHEKYAGFEADANGVLTEIAEAELPKPILERARKVVEAATGKEAAYMDDVKLSVLCSMHNLFQGIETFVPVDDAITAPFKAAFSSEENPKLQEVLTEICDGVIGKMMDKLIKLICVPEGLPDDLIGILMMLSGGMPMMNFAEMEGMFGRGEPDDDDDDDESDEESNDEDDDTADEAF